MRALLARLRRDRRGATAMEFAITVPIFLSLMFGMVQTGMLFFANAGLQNALGDSARVATLWPNKTEADMRAEITASRFGIDPAKMAEPVFTYGTAGGQNFVEIRLTYNSEIDFIFFTLPGLTLEHSRRAYLP